MYLKVEMRALPKDGMEGRREDGGVSGVSSGCCAHGGFLTRHDEDLRDTRMET